MLLCMMKMELGLTQENGSSGFPTSSDTNQSVKSQKNANSLKFWIYVEKGWHYPCRENKGADQLCSY